MEALTPEIAAGLFRAAGDPVICTRGERVIFANPAARELLGEDPAGKHASAYLPESLLHLQGGLGAASVRIRGRDAIATLSGAGVYRAYFLRLMPEARRMPPLPTPQWSVLANLRLAAEHFALCPSEDDRLHAAKLLKSYYQLQRWFINVSTLSALQEGSLPFQPLATDCAALLHRIAEHLAPLAAPQGVRVGAELPEQAPLLLLDEELMERLLFNLLLNSLLHCESGGSVRLSMSLTDSEVILTVQDTGSGIPPERLGTLFESFDVRPVPEGKGAGCGLPVVLGIARLHGGDVLVSSTPRFGTAVRVALPRREPGNLTLRADPPDYGGKDREDLLVALADYLRPEDFLRGR